MLSTATFNTATSNDAPAAMRMWEWLDARLLFLDPVRSTYVYESDGGDAEHDEVHRALSHIAFDHRRASPADREERYAATGEKPSAAHASHQGMGLDTTAHAAAKRLLSHPAVHRVVASMGHKHMEPADQPSLPPRSKEPKPSAKKDIHAKYYKLTDPAHRKLLKAAGIAPGATREKRAAQIATAKSSLPKEHPFHAAHAAELESRLAIGRKKRAEAEAKSAKSYRAKETAHIAHRGEVEKTRGRSGMEHGAMGSIAPGGPRETAATANLKAGLLTKFSKAHTHQTNAQAAQLQHHLKQRQKHIDTEAARTGKHPSTINVPPHHEHGIETIAAKTGMSAQEIKNHMRGVEDVPIRSVAKELLRAHKEGRIKKLGYHHIGGAVGQHIKLRHQDVARKERRNAPALSQKSAGGGKEGGERDVADIMRPESVKTGEETMKPSLARRAEKQGSRQRSDVWQSRDAEKQEAAHAKKARAMAEKGQSHVQIAKALGVHHKDVSQMLGKNRPRLVHQPRLARNVTKGEEPETERISKLRTALGKKGEPHKGPISIVGAVRKLAPTGDTGGKTPRGYKPKLESLGEALGVPQGRQKLLEAVRKRRKGEKPPVRKVKDVENAAKLLGVTPGHVERAGHLGTETGEPTHFPGGAGSSKKPSLGKASGKTVGSPVRAAMANEKKAAESRATSQKSRSLASRVHAKMQKKHDTAAKRAQASITLGGTDRLPPQPPAKSHLAKGMELRHALRMDLHKNFPVREKDVAAHEPPALGGKKAREVRGYQLPKGAPAKRTKNPDDEKNKDYNAALARAHHGVHQVVRKLVRNVMNPSHPVTKEFHARERGRAVGLSGDEKRVEGDLVGHHLQQMAKDPEIHAHLGLSGKQAHKHAATALSAIRERLSAGASNLARAAHRLHGVGTAHEKQGTTAPTNQAAAQRRRERSEVGPSPGSMRDVFPSRTKLQATKSSAQAKADKEKEGKETAARKAAYASRSTKPPEFVAGAKGPVAHHYDVKGGLPVPLRKRTKSERPEGQFKIGNLPPGQHPEPTSKSTQVKRDPDMMQHFAQRALERKHKQEDTFDWLDAFARGRTTVQEAVNFLCESDEIMTIDEAATAFAHIATEALFGGSLFERVRAA